MRRTPFVPLALAAVSLGVATLASPATAAVDPTIVIDGLSRPLSVAVTENGSVYVSQNFTGVITQGGTQAPAEIYADEQGNEVGSVSAVTLLGRGADPTTVTFTTSTPKGHARLWTLSGGTLTKTAELGIYERTANPDGTTTYGIGGLGARCEAAIPRKVRPDLVAHPGGRFSHPLATFVSEGTTFVADAGANAIVSVDAQGPSTVAVLPPVRVKVDGALRRLLDLPRCTVGAVLRSEATPTDVELAPDGDLYVTTMGGFLGQIAPVGALYRISIATGATTRIADSLPAPVGLAIEPNGTTYVSMLGSGVIVRQAVGGVAATFASVDFPGDVEYQAGVVYATATDQDNDGTSPPAGQVLSWPAPPVCRAARC